jgi:hypothetical protein
MPASVQVLPDFSALPALGPGPTPVTRDLALDPASVDALPLLSDSPLPRATLVAWGPAHTLVLVGDKGELRQQRDPLLADAQLLATSLSPDGTQVALPTAQSIALVEVRTGAVRQLPGHYQQPQPPLMVWLDDHTVAVPAEPAQGAGHGMALAVDVQTGESRQGFVLALGALAMRGGPSMPITALLANTELQSRDDVGPTVGQSVLVHFDLAGTIQDMAQVTGPPWLHGWIGPGFVSSQVIARGCDPGPVRLPGGRPSAAVVALDEQGGYLGTLVTFDGSALSVVGFQPADGQQPPWVLVAVRSVGAGALVAWSPTTRVTAFEAMVRADTDISVRDLLLRN